VRRHANGLDLSGFPTPSTVLAVDVMGRYVQAAEQDLRGFATNPRVVFRFSEPYDFGSVGGGNLRLINLASGGAPGFSWITTSGSFSNYTCDNVLVAGTGPGAPLLPNTTYAMVVLDGVTPAAGGSFERSTDLAALLGNTSPADPVLAEHWPKYAPLRAWLGTEGISPASVLNATVFTTQEPEALVPRLREVVRAAAPPVVTDLVLCDTGVTSPCDDGTPLRACGPADPDMLEVHGRIRLPIFQDGTAPYEEPADGGGIATDATGTPLVARTEDVCFALTLPTGDPMPMAGWPLVVYAHGTGGSFRGGIADGIAHDLATGSPATATLAIDLPQHGERRGGSERPPEELFFNFANPRAARDNILQGTADLMATVHAAQDVNLAAGSSPTGTDIYFDPSRIALFAHSQGATHGSIALPYDPAFIAALLSGHGGNLTQSLLTKREPVDLATLLPIALLDMDADGNLPLRDMHPGLAVWQMFFERVDPLNYARRLHRAPVEGDPGRHVFMTYGVGDLYSTEATMRAYALAAGLTLVEPILVELPLTTAAPPLSANRTVDGNTWTIGMRQYAPPEGVDGHFVSTRNATARADVLRFLRAAAAGDTPPIGQ
jgi:hypothetical protein